MPANTANAVEIAGIRVAPQASVGGTNLVLNGAGLRQRFMTDVYVIGLYLPAITTSAESAAAASGPTRIALTMMRDVTANALIEALHEGVRDNTTKAEFARLQASADALAAVMQPLHMALKGDVVALDYLPGIGAQVMVNGRAEGRPIPDRDLYRALLRIWLGTQPVDAELKRALLSGRRQGH